MKNQTNAHEILFFMQFVYRFFLKFSLFADFVQVIVFSEQFVQSNLAY